MADITKRTAKKAKQHLTDGETVEAVLLCEAKGTYGIGSIPTAVFPRTMTKHLERQAGRSNTEAGGMAAGFPGKSCVLAVTDRRVLVMPSNGLRFDAPVMELEIGDVGIGSVGAKGLGKRFSVVFSDGSAVSVDAQRGQPFDRVAELLGSVDHQAD